MGKKPKRKTEPCEFCNGKHFSEQARLRCMKAAERQKCECDRYWQTRWLTHQPKCPQTGTLRDAVIPYTKAELEARAARSETSATVRRKAAA